MNRKFLTIAIAAALAAPTAVLADVTVYGKLHMSGDYIDNDGTDTTTQDAANLNFSSNSSRIGFKGSEDLGGGLKAVWQLESGVTMGGTATAPRSPVSSSSSTTVATTDTTTGLAATIPTPTPGRGDTFTSRNSYLGLAGGFGTVLMGNHDTPFKMFGRNFDVFGDTVADNRQLLNAGGAWDLRPSNVLAYITPNLNGFSGVLAYVSGIAQTTTGADNNKASAFSLNGTYKNGPIYLGAAYEVHTVKDALGLTNDPSAFRLGGSFTTGGIKVGAMYQALKDADGVSAERDDYTLFGTYSFGMETVKLAYTYAGEWDTNAGTANNTDASLFALGLDHKFSKRTTGYVQYTMVSNETASAYGIGANSGYGNPVASAADKSPSAFSVGLIHNF